VSGIVLCCPHCNIDIVLKELPHQGLLASFRVCPECGGAFTVDPDTKIRQGIFIFVALLSLVFTVFLYFEFSGWLVPSLSSYVALGLLIYRGNKKMYLVPWPPDKTSSNDP
jgi:hypothetical protein